LYTNATQASIPESYELLSKGRSSDLLRFIRPSHLRLAETVTIRLDNRCGEHSSGTVRDSNPVPF
jgi:hypothetical protein